MRGTEKRSLQAFRRVQAFLDANAPSLTSSTSNSPVYQKQRTMLDAAVERLTARAVEQGSSQMDDRGGAALIRALRTTLREQHMRPIAELAKGLHPDVPDIEKLRLPKERIDLEALITAAGSMGEAASPYSALFVEHGQPADFLAQLASAAAALREAVDARGTAGSRGVGATEGIAAEVAGGRRALQLIQAVIRPMILKMPQLLAEWQSARRIGGRSHRSTKAGVKGSTAPARKGSKPATASTTPAPDSSEPATGSTTPAPDGAEPATVADPAAAAPAEAPVTGTAQEAPATQPVA